MLFTELYFLDTYAYKMDEAIEVYETALGRYTKRTTSYGDWDLRTVIKDHLCQLYYHKAKAAESAGTQFDHWVSKLEDLAKTRDVKRMQDASVSEDSSLVLGLWYRLHGKEQEAKRCFRTQILNGIDILTDEDSMNDLFAYITLAITLLKAGDRENAGAVFAVIIAPLDRLKVIQRAALVMRTRSQNKRPLGHYFTRPTLQLSSSRCRLRRRNQRLQILRKISKSQPTTRMMAWSQPTTKLT